MGMNYYLKLDGNDKCEHCGRSDDLETLLHIDDTRNDVNDIVSKILRHQLLVDINIVRYNSPDSNSQETAIDKIQSLADKLAGNLGRHVQIVKRVGMDVKASCGMFVAPDFEV